MPPPTFTLPPADRLFLDPSALEPDRFVPRSELFVRQPQWDRLEWDLGRFDASEGRSALTVALVGPPGTGETTTALAISRLACQELGWLGVLNVPLATVRTKVAAVSERYRAVTLEPLPANVGFDAGFDRVWDGFADYADRIVIVLDDVDLKRVRGRLGLHE